MNILQFIYETIKEIIKLLLFEWVLILKSIIISICKWFCEFIKRLKKSHADNHSYSEKCDTIRHPSFHKPDPLIYSQSYLKSLGLAVTWNNPDIIFIKDGILVKENELLPDTEYEIHATIWNNSYEAPIAALPVSFSFLSFGASSAENGIGTTSVNLGVKGSPSHPATAIVNWRTPATPGHFCIKTKIIWDNDANQANNIGQNNVNVIESSSPAPFNFQLKNTGKKNRTYSFVADSYTLPGRELCDIKSSKSNEERWKEISGNHHPSQFPLPLNWIVHVDQDGIELLADQEVEITGEIIPPDDFMGSKYININAFFGDGTMEGGVTFLVEKK